MGIAENLAAVRAEVAADLARFGRQPGDVTLIAVSKFKSVSEIEEALAAGQRVFGENRVQEAAAKFPDLRQAHPDLELHLIGPLQTNKAGDALGLVDVIQTVDRARLAEVLAAKMSSQYVRTKRLLIQVNTGEEPQKAGIQPADADHFIRDCIDRLRLPIAGLMCIPPADDEPALHFALLREMAKRQGLTELSMGMSGDYRHAIQQGATSIRVGTAIFGARDVAA